MCSLGMRAKPSLTSRSTESLLRSRVLSSPIPMGCTTMTLNTRSRGLDPYESVSPLSAGSKPRLRVFNVIVVQPIGIGEDSSRLLKRDSVLLEVSEGFARIPREHITVYTLITALGQLAPVLQFRS